MPRRRGARGQGIGEQGGRCGGIGVDPANDGGGIGITRQVAVHIAEEAQIHAGIDRAHVGGVEGNPQVTGPRRGQEQPGPRRAAGRGRLDGPDATTELDQRGERAATRADPGHAAIPPQHRVLRLGIVDPQVELGARGGAVDGELGARVGPGPACRRLIAIASDQAGVKDGDQGTGGPGQDRGAGIIGTVQGNHPVSPPRAAGPAPPAAAHKGKAGSPAHPRAAGCNPPRGTAPRAARRPGSSSTPTAR